MIERIHSLGRGIFELLRRPLSRAFDSEQNPLNHLGALTVYFCWIVLVSGIWLLIFFRTSVSSAFESVEYLTREQWYLGGVQPLDPWWLTISGIRRDTAGIRISS